MGDSQDYKIKIVTEADTSGNEAQIDAQKKVAESAKETERQAAAAAKEAAEAQKAAAREVEKEAERAMQEQIKEAQELAKELLKAAEAREKLAASEARSLDGFMRSGANQSSASAWAEEAGRVFGDFGGKAGKAQVATEGLLASAGKLGAIAAAGAAAWGAYSQVIVGTLQEFAKEELAVLQLEAAMRTAGVASDEYLEKLQNLAGTLSEDVTNVGGDQWLAILTQLTQAGANSSNIDEVAEGVKNLAGLMGGNVDQAAGVFARALRGNFEMLGRFGFEVEETASQTEKMGELMKVAAQGAGVLEARAGTLTGKTEQLGSAWGDLKKAIGGINESLAKSVIDGLASAIKGLTSLLPKAKVETHGLTNAQNELKAATDKTTKSLDQQQAMLSGAARQAEAVANAFERARRAQQGDQSRADEITDAKAAREEAKITAFEKAGRITPDQAAAAKDIVRGRAEKEKFDRAQKGRADEIKSRTDETDRLEKDAVDASRKARGSGKKEDLEEAERVSQLFVERARANAERIEELRKEIEQENQLFNLKQDTRSVEARGDILGANRKKREEAEKAKKNAKPDKLTGQRKEAADEAKEIGQEAAGLKGRSTDSTNRLLQAAEALKDGGTPEELNGLNAALDKVATSLERIGQQDKAKPFRELQGRVSRLEGVVRRLESQQGTSGS